MHQASKDTPVPRDHRANLGSRASKVPRDRSGTAPRASRELRGLRVTSEGLVLTEGEGCQASRVLQDVRAIKEYQEMWEIPDWGKYVGF